MQSRYDGYEILMCEYYDCIGRNKALEHNSTKMYYYGSFVKGIYCDKIWQ